MFGLHKSKKRMKASGWGSTTYSIHSGRRRGQQVEYGINKWGERFTVMKKKRKGKARLFY